VTGRTTGLYESVQTCNITISTISGSVHTTIQCDIVNVKFGKPFNMAGLGSPTSSVYLYLGALACSIFGIPGGLLTSD
jgi:hypothetical protein